MATKSQHERYAQEAWTRVSELDHHRMWDRSKSNEVKNLRESESEDQVKRAKMHQAAAEGKARLTPDDKRR